MSWARYDDELPMNRKVGALLQHGAHGAAAIGLHVLANTWSRHNGTAGAIPTHQVGLLVGDTKLGRRLAVLLADVGMFDVIEGGWMIHDFDDYSDPNDDGRSAAERKAELSAVRAAAGRRGGLAKAGKLPGKPDGKRVAEPQQTSGPVPVPVPIVQVGDNSTSENTGNGGGDNSRRDAVLDVYALAELNAARRRGDVRNERGYLAKARATGAAHEKLDAWLATFPTAQPTAIAAWLQGDTHSMAYCERADQLATIHPINGGPAA